jgi:CRP/FNR family transcriptional regulator, anaerobic regulatory protein
LYPIHRWQAFANLTADEAQALHTLGDVEETYSAGGTIRLEGEDASGFYLHLHGWVTSSVSLPNGARLIQKVHLPGDVLGATSMVLSRAADTLTAVTEVRLSFVPFQRLREIYMRLPRLAALITCAAQMERLSLMDALVVKGRASAKQQLAALFLDLHARLTPIGAVKDDGFDMPLTQEHIGDLTGLTSVHVNRVVRELREQGLIARGGKRLRILDIGALRTLAPLAPRRPLFEPAWLPSPHGADARQR